MSVERAITFSARKHHGQMYGELPYVLHTLQVMLGIPKEIATEIVLSAAVLHDVVEDTDVTLEELAAEFGIHVATIVDALTKRTGEVYLTEYIPRVKENAIAVQIKLVDLRLNLLGGSKNPSLALRYSKALEILQA